MDEWSWGTWYKNVCVGKTYCGWTPNPTLYHIDSPDTDVFLVACYQFTSRLATLDNLWIKPGTGDKKKYFAIHKVGNHFGSSMLKSLTAFHVITGCDSVSSFSGIEKKTALTTLWSNLDDMMEILQSGDSPNLDLQEACVKAAIKFVYLLYANKSKDADINGTCSFPRKVDQLKIAANPLRINIAFEKGSLSVLHLEEWQREFWISHVLSKVIALLLEEFQMIY